ncbi:hypothetical protein ACLOJK_015491 [Asimina triloba]
MELQQESSKLGAICATTSRNLSSSSSTFVSASQSPFFSPRSPTSHELESTKFDASNSSSALPLARDTIACTSVQNSEPLRGLDFAKLDALPAAAIHASGNCLKPTAERIKILTDQASSPNGICSSHLSPYSQGTSNGGVSGNKERKKRWGRNHGQLSFTPSSASLSSSSRLRSCDVYIGLHGRKPSLIRFANWLHAELEVQGVSCFSADRSRCRNARSHETVERAMDSSAFGVVILTKKSFANTRTIEELRYFLGKKNLVPIFFDLAPGDCLVRDIIERRGELWEKHGGELWMLYGGLEKEWKEAVNGLSRVEEWKLEAHDGNWRDCILRTVVLLATRLGRRSVVERVNRWAERVEKEEFPFPRNENFIGRKKELSELELILFGDVSGNGEKEYFELKTRYRRRKNLVIRHSGSKRAAENGTVETDQKGKEPVIWKETEKEIEMQRAGSPLQKFRPLRSKSGGRYGKRKRSSKIIYGKGIACVSGDSGIGKTELLLEFAYQFSQRYKMVLWVGGETRYIRQNYLNLWSFLEVDVSIENSCTDNKSRVKSFEEQEEEAISRVRRELMRDIPFLVVIDNLEREKDWWDQKFIMDLLPRFGGETHFIIATRLPRVMNLEPLKLSYLSGMEAMSLMKGRFKEYPIVEIDALRSIEEKLRRLTLGLAIVGAILSELPIDPSRLLDTINRMPMRDLAWSSRDAPILRCQTFLIQLLDVCFSIFDHADGPRSLATRMVQVSGFFAPAPIPIPLLALAAHKVPMKHQHTQLWKKFVRAVTCSFTTSHLKRSEAEAAAMLVRFGIAKSSTKPGCIHFHELIRLYACKRRVAGVAEAMVQSISIRGSISHHPEHIWAACFSLFGFGSEPAVVKLKVAELLFLVKRIVLPLAIHTFITFSRCNAALELLRLCTETLESAEDTLVSQAENWLDRSLCWRKPAQSTAQLNPYLWQELALLKATVLETRVKLMLRGGQYDAGDDLIRKVIYIRTSICGDNHPDTIAAQETLTKLTRLLMSTQG